MGLVGLAVFVVDGEHDLLMGVIGRGVLLGVAQAVLGRELAAVEVALLGKEGEYLVEHDGVLGLHQLAGLLVAHAAGGLVMAVTPPGRLHMRRPSLDVDAIHVLASAQKELEVIGDVGAQVVLVSRVDQPGLFDDGHFVLSASFSVSRLEVAPSLSMFLLLCA